MTWNDLIDLSFIDLAVIQPGASITTSMRTDAQSRLNALVSSLNTEQLTVFNQVMQVFNLSAGVSAYTLGSGGTFATTSNLRAQKVTAWRAAYAGVLSRGGGVLSMAELGARANQQGGELAAIPEFVGADTSYPLINVRVFPPPSATPGTLELAYWVPIAQISDFTATISLPEGWPEMLHWNLALRLFPQYARPGQVIDVIAGNAQNAKASIVNQNSMQGAAPQQGQQ